MYCILEAISSISVRGLPTQFKHLDYLLGNRIPFICCNVRNYTDPPKSDSKKNLEQGTDTDQVLRVRLARPADIPRVLRFIRGHARVWPGPLAPPSNLVVGDYVSRTLAQGHSMLAEQQPTATRSEVLGLALISAVCPWDADSLERWARCVRCSKSRRFLNFTAHCLRAPKLHDIYGVRNIFQVILIVPPNAAKNTEIVSVLAKNAIKRGKEAGFSLVRFDVNKDSEIINVAPTDDPHECKIDNNKWQGTFNEQSFLEINRGHLFGIRQNYTWVTHKRIIQHLDPDRDNTSKVVPENFVSVYTAQISSSGGLIK